MKDAGTKKHFMCYMQRSLTYKAVCVREDRNTAHVMRARLTTGGTHDHCDLYRGVLPDGVSHEQGYVTLVSPWNGNEGSRSVSLDVLRVYHV